MKNNTLCLMCVLLTMDGCASRYGKNQPLFNTTGYTDEKIEKNTYYLKYRSNALTSLEQTKSYWNRRAEELCGVLKVEAIHEEKMVREIYTLSSRIGDPYSYDINFPEIVGIVKCIFQPEE